MADLPEREAELTRLISAPPPPSTGSGGRWRRIVSRVSRLLSRDVVTRQREIDTALANRLAELAAAVDQLRDRGAEQAARFSDLRGWLELASARGEETAGRLDAFVADQQRELARIDRRVADDVALYGGDGFVLETFDAGLGGEVVGFRSRGSDAGDGVYLGFEDLFRGSEEKIRSRQRAYIPLLKSREPVLDIGCGRGEFLELLRDASIDAAGIDIDPAMVEHCRGKGLDRVEIGDAVSHLEGLRDGSLGAIFAAQVIEHLPYRELLGFLRAATAKLTPAGVLIMETVNPHAPQALKHFWIDPTHQHPLFPETVLALCQLTGFASAFVWHPLGSGNPNRDRGEQPDYSVVAETPTQAASA